MVFSSILHHCVYFIRWKNNIERKDKFLVILSESLMFDLEVGCFNGKAASDHHYDFNSTVGKYSLGDFL